MSSIVTPMAVDPAVEGALLTGTFTPHECAYCRGPIVSGQRWVREKIYEPAAENGPRYRRYHADLFAEEELSCWEKHELEKDIACTVRRLAA